MTNAVLWETLDKIRLNENVYIYRKASGRPFPKRTITQLFADIRLDKGEDNPKTLFSLVNDPGATRDNRQYKFSGLVIRYNHIPTFLTEYIPNWIEQKIAYIFLIDFGDYLVMSKKNVSGVESFLKSLEPIDYEVLSKLFIEPNSYLEKLSLENLDISSSAMRNKAVEADNLTENYNYQSANTYTINNLRINNNDTRYLVALNSSRISKAGDKSEVVKFIEWTSETTNKITNYVPSETFLDVFAKPCDYSKTKQQLIPLSLTILFSKLIDDLASKQIVGVRYNYDNKKRKINLSRFLKGLSMTISLVAGNKPDEYEADFDSRVNDIRVKLNPKSITIFSKKLHCIELIKIGNEVEYLSAYINNRSSFLVNFDDCEYIYSKRKLFKDSELLGSIPYFLDVFEPSVALNNMNSEKGNPTPNSTMFDNDCVFSFVEQSFSNTDFLVLDDLGNEWADHISINEDKITFIHSKCGDQVFSATAFTDLVGQALKNICNMFAPDTVIENKRDHWQQNFNLNNVQTQIARLRLGNDVDSFIDRYKKIKLRPNAKRAIYLALNFISKALLTTNLQLLKDGQQFAQRKQTVQILWLLSSLIANCKESSIEIKIFCKP